jgi:hypothetical protein
MRRRPATAPTAMPPRPAFDPRGFLPPTALVLLGLSALAFWPPYLSRLRSADNPTHVHAALGVAWLLVLAAQPLLVRARRLTWHRRLGWCATVLGAAFVASGIVVAHRALNRMDPAQFAREGHALYLPLVMAAIFGAALALGIAWRSVPAVHGRFMACTALPLLDPLLARILHFHGPPVPIDALHQAPAFALTAVVLLVLAQSLAPQVRGRRAFQAFAVGAVLALLAFFLTPFSPGWQRFVEAFRTLALP